MFENVAALIAEHAELQEQLGDPALHGDPVRAKRVNRRYAELSRIVAAHAAWRQASDDLAAARELAAEDETVAAELRPEIEALEGSIDASAQTLRLLLIPRDENDSRDAIMEIKMGEGGEESALFAGDLLRMYLRYAESRGWRTEIIEQTPTDLGGIKDVQLAIKGSSSDPAEGVWAHLKYEGGVHRVQRVPVTETQGRIHTSAAGVLVFPEVDAPEEIQIDPNELRVDVFRSSGPGGQSVNTTDSAVRITHLPTGIVISMQDEKSQIQNRAAAMTLLKNRLLLLKREEEAAKKKELAGNITASWGDQIRSYFLYGQQLVKDLRTDHEVSRPEAVFDGDLDGFVSAGIKWRKRKDD